MAVQLTDGTNNNVVDPTSKGILVQPSKVVTQAGFVLSAYQQDSGSVVGTPSNLIPAVSPDSRLSVGMDSMLFNDVFDYTVQNTNNWKFSATTMTQTFATGYTVLNGGAITTASTYALMQTYRSFPIYRPGSFHLEFRLQLTAAPQTNNYVAFGLSVAPGTTAASSDGVYFQYDTTGALKAVLSYNGVQTTVAIASIPSTTAVHEFAIDIADDLVTYWIDGVIVANITAPGSSPVSTLASSMYAFVQIYNGGTAPAAAQTVKVGACMMWQYDENVNKPYSHIQAGSGLSALIGQNGGTMGQTAAWTNSSAPTAAVPSNTVVSVINGLGGIGYETASIAVNTDGIVCGYGNPAGSTTQPPRVLYITGIRWQSIVQTVLAGGPFVYAHALAFGHTAASLATTEAANAKAPRRIGLGVSTFPATAAVGTVGAQLVHQFTTPIVVNPGEFIECLVRNVGTVGTSGTIMHVIGFEGYWE